MSIFNYFGRTRTLELEEKNDHLQKLIDLQTQRIYELENAFAAATAASVSSTPADNSPPSSVAPATVPSIANIHVYDADDSSGLHYVKITGNLACVVITGLPTRIDVAANNRRISVNGDFSRLVGSDGPYESREIMETGVSRLLSFIAIR